MQYPLRFSFVDGDIVVTSRDFPELLTAAETEEAAMAMAEDALEVVLLTYVEKGHPLPVVRDPESDERIVFVRPQAAAKLLVIKAFEDAGISKSELARRMDIGDNEAHRILDPNHGTKLDKLYQASLALGKRLIVDMAA
jgi:antitoxin HicB